MLIVDDNYFDSVALMGLFEQYQLSVENAYDGLKAFDMVKKRFESTGSTYKLIMMETVMSICNGCDSTRMIRRYLNEQAPQLQQPLIIGMTNNHAEQYTKQAMLAGMDLFCTKPIWKSIVVSILKKAKLSQQNDRNHH